MWCVSCGIPLDVDTFLCDVCIKMLHIREREEHEEIHNEEKYPL